MATPAPAVSNQSNVLEQKLRIEQALKGSSSWFITIAVLSLVNSVLAMTRANIQFIFGLGFTQIVDALAHQAGGAGLVLDLVINGIIAGVFALFWSFARKGQKWAWYAGMGLYAVDALLLLPAKDFLSIAFHAYALYRMSMGLKLLPMMERLNHSQATGAVSSTF